VDGSVHDTPEAQANDKLRDETLKHWGFQVQRVRNEEVLNDVEAVLSKIMACFKNSPSCF
jgi:very-short-patch-repair endonuclease